MTTVHRLEEIPYEKNSVITVGSFDGVHLAHQEVLGEVVRRAQNRKGRAVVLTFEPHPKEVLSGKPAQLLTTPEEKERLCERLGVDLFFVVPFTYEFSRQSSRDFFINYLVHRIGVSEVVEGYDHHFGRDREGSVEELLRLGKEFEFSMVAMKPVHVEEEVVSSSRIRQYLLAGAIDKAERMLGRPYSIEGTVVRGDGRGKSLGFPTANIRASSDRKLIPANGIYVVEVVVDDQRYAGILSIGVRPTFTDNGRQTVEVFILEFDADLYDRNITIRILKRLRDELKFDSVEALIRQMHEDREETLRFLAQHHRNLIVSRQV